MRKTRTCHRHPREVGPAAPAGGRLVAREVPAGADFQGRPTRSALTWKLLVRGAQLVAAVALSQFCYRWAPWLALPGPRGVIAVGLLLTLASSHLLPARSLEKAARWCSCVAYAGDSGSDLRQPKLTPIRPRGS